MGALFRFERSMTGGVHPLDETLENLESFSRSPPHIAGTANHRGHRIAARRGRRRARALDRPEQLHRASTVKAGQEDNQGAHNSSSTGGFLLNAAKKATWIKKGNGGTTISCCARVAVNNGARDKAIGSSEE
uniref:Uncharacterized protein n=1 Tax=Oryza glumipatula TaxID=40148 RepID=A0A0D9Z4B1_9ORYZ